MKKYFEFDIDAIRFYFRFTTQYSHDNLIRENYFSVKWRFHISNASRRGDYGDQSLPEKT